MTRMVRIYIAGPVMGIPESNGAAFSAAMAALVAAGYRVTNPLHLVPPGMGGARAMRRLIPELCACDGVCLLGGWESSEGACVEVAVARACGLEIGNLDHWIVSLGGRR